MIQLIEFSLLGFTAGMFSGLLGVGGAVIIIPALIMLFGYSQKMAQGTTLALMVLPIGFLAAMEYLKAGFVNIKVGLIIALFFFVGGWFGGKIAIHLDSFWLKKGFAVLLLGVAIKFFLEK